MRISAGVGSLMTRLLFLINGVLPVTVGGLIYLLFRGESIIMFSWVDMTGLGSALTIARNWIGDYGIPNWALYNLPAGLWAYSLSSILLVVWKSNRVGLVWVSIGVVLALGSEFGQALGFVPGTFSSGDVLAYALGFGLSHYLNFKKYWQ